MLADIARYFNITLSLWNTQHRFAVFTFEITMSFSVVPHLFPQINFIFEFLTYIIVCGKLTAPRGNVFRETAEVHPYHHHKRKGQKERQLCHK
jgi:hypothetical protein